MNYFNEILREQRREAEISDNLQQRVLKDQVNNTFGQYQDLQFELQSSGPVDIRGNQSYERGSNSQTNSSLIFLRDLQEHQIMFFEEEQLSQDSSIQVEIISSSIEQKFVVYCMIVDKESEESLITVQNQSIKDQQLTFQQLYQMLEKYQNQLIQPDQLLHKQFKDYRQTQEEKYLFYQLELLEQKQASIVRYDKNQFTQNFFRKLKF